MTIRRPIVPWLVVLALIVIVFLAVGILLRNSVAATFDTGQRARTARTLLFDAIKGQIDEETGLRGYLATGDRGFLQPYHEARGYLPGTLVELEATLKRLGLTPAADSVADAARDNESWLRSIAQPLLLPGAKDTLAMQRLGKTLVDRYRRDTSNVERQLNRQNAELNRDFQVQLLRFGLMLAFAALLLFVGGLAFARLQARSWDSLDRERERREEARLRERGLRSAYEAEKRIADALQEAFSQRILPTTTSMSFSATYVPATEEAKVGGDWYDAFEIESNRILFTIGDIAGHGLDAAVAMSRVRNEMLSAALLDPNAESILAHVNRRILERSGPMVTAIVGSADPRTFEFVYSTAGHPPPLLVEPGRPPRRLDFGGVPLGVTDKAVYRTHRVQTVPGAMLVLYTDGAIEHSRDIIAGEQALLEAVAAIPAGADAATTIYQSIFHDKSVGDDVAILTVGFAQSHPLGMTISARGAESEFAGKLDPRPGLASPLLRRLAS